MVIVVVYLVVGGWCVLYIERRILFRQSTTQCGSSRYFHSGCIQAGCGVEVIAEIPSANKNSKRLLEKGFRGIVVQIDKDGDALIKFEGVDVRQWVFSKNLHLLRVTGTESELHELVITTKFVIYHGSCDFDLFLHFLHFTDFQVVDVLSNLSSFLSISVSGFEKIEINSLGLIEAKARVHAHYGN